LETAIGRTPNNWFGWVAGAGAGAEARVGGSIWIVRAEYLHYDFGSVEVKQGVNASAGTSFNDRVGRQTIDVVRGGLSYKY